MNLGNKNVIDYIKLFENCISEEVCDKSLEELENVKWHQHEFYEFKTNNIMSLSGNKELYVTHSTISTRQKIHDCIYECIGSYIEALNFSWYNGWSGFTGVRFNRYKRNQKMALHCDHIHSIFSGDVRGIPTLSVVGGLNNKYSGGEFIMFEDTHVPIPKGSILIFPSNFMYPHKVLPVKKGVRHSFVSWVY